MTRRILVLGTALTLALAAAPPAPAQSVAAGAVYTMSNAADGNAVVVYDRAADGSIEFQGVYPTGGLGSGGGLGNQGGIALSGNDRWLLAVNAGSNELSVFRVRPRGLVLTDRAFSYGSLPISVTESQGIVYVLNAGSLDIAGFRLTRQGRLEPIAGSVRAIGGSGAAPAQVGLSPRADALAVTLKDSNEIVTFTIDRDGYPGSPVVNASNGATPFGFAFGKRDQLFVTEAAPEVPGGSSLSSYEVGGDASLETLTASAPTHQTAACWVSVSPSGRYAYTANTPDASITGFRIGHDGELTLLDPSGVTASTGAGSAPVDMAFAQNGRFLYVLNSGSHTIGAFRVDDSGALEPLATAPAVPAAANGIAAR